MNASISPPTSLASRTAARSRWLVALVLLALIIAGFFDRISIAVLFTNHDFQTAMGTGFNPALLGLLMTSFLFAYGFSGIVLGFVGDIFGPRRSMLASAALWGIFMVLMGGAVSYALMIVYRILLGIAEGPQFSLTNKVVKRWFPAHEHARANSVWMIGSPLGSAIGFPLTIYLVATWGWRASFYALGAFDLLIVLPLIFFIIRDWPPEMDEAARAAETTKRLTWSDVRVFLGDWRFWMVLIFNSAALIYLWGLNAWLPTYLLQVRHFNVRDVSIFSSLPFLLMFAGEVGAAALSDWLGRRAAICFIGLFGAGVFVYLTSLVSDPYLAAVLIAVSAGFWGAALPTLFALALDIIPPSVTASGVGVYNGVGNVIGACSPLAMGWIIGATHSFSAGLLVMVFAGVLGACSMLPLMKRH